MPQCRACSVALTEENCFPSSWKHGSHICASCDKARRRQWRINNPEKDTRSRRAWFAANDKRCIFLAKRGHAKRLGVPFTLTFEKMTWPVHCPVLGMELDYSTGTKGGSNRPNSPSFDQIIPAGGYTDANTIIVSVLANRIKNNATVEQLEAVAAFYRRLQSTTG
jgi:hypothetical protein